MVFLCGHVQWGKAILKKNITLMLYTHLVSQYFSPFILPFPFIYASFTIAKPIFQAAI